MTTATIEKVIPNSFAVSGDLCDPSFCKTITEKNDVIFLLSGNTSIKEAENDPMKNLVTNVFPIINIINVINSLSNRRSNIISVKS